MLWPLGKRNFYILFSTGLQLANSLNKPPLAPRKTRLSTTATYILFCFSLAFYLGLAPWLELNWGLWGVALGQIFIFGIIPVGFAAFFPTPLKNIFPFRQIAFQELLWILLWSSLAIALANLELNLQNRHWPLPQPEIKYYQKLLRHLNFLELSKKLLILGLIPAFCEEIFFRGLIQSHLYGKFGMWLSIFLSGLLFSLAHFELRVLKSPLNFSLANWRLAIFFILQVTRYPAKTGLATAKADLK